MIKNKNTPKAIPSSEPKKNTGIYTNSYASSKLNSINESGQAIGVHKSNQSAFDNYYNLILSPKS
jgi:hypothetical protein